MKLDIQLFADGKVRIETELDTNNFQKGLDKMKSSAEKGGTSIKNIVAGLGITKLIGSAFNTITSNMDSAIKRLDTLNNFPKVMSNLGIGAEDAERSIAKMSDKLVGLPTTLDQGAMAVQRFTSSNGDVAKSTDLFLALNNAILAGGASSEIQSSALEQLSQAYAKGKPDMMEWRTAMTAMPAQLKQVAEAMGFVDASALGEALRDGSVSMDDFMDTIMKLNTEGVNGFQSFEEQAKNSTGGLQTTIANAKNAVVRGVAGMVEALDKGFKDAGLGGLGEVIQNLGKGVENVFKKLTPYITSFVKIVAKVYEWVMKNKDVIIAILVPIASFIVAMQTIQKVISIVTTAQAILNAVMLANPITLIVAAIVALVAGFIYLWKTSEDFRNFWIGLWEGIKNAVSTVIDGIVTFFTETIPNAVQSIVDFLGGVWESIKTFFTTTIPTTISNFVQSVIDFFNQLPYMIGYVIGLIIGHIVKWVERLVEFVTVDIPNFIKGVIDWFQQLPGKIWEFILKVIEKIKEWGTNLINFAKTEIPKFINNVVNFFKELPGKIWTWLVNTISKVVQWVSDMKTKAVNGIVKVVSGIINGFKELPSKVMSIGKNVVQGIWNGISGAKNWIVGKVKDFAKGILDGMKSALGIHSPSRLFRDQIGKNIALGVGEGFTDNIRSVFREMQEAVDIETGKMTANVQTSGTYQMAMEGSPTFNLRDNSTNQTQLVVNGKVLAEVVNTENRNREVAKA